MVVPTGSWTGFPGWLKGRLAMTTARRPQATPPDVEDIRRRAEGAAQQRLPGVRLRPLVAFTAGSSSLTYSAQVDGASVEHVVVKAAPAGLAPVRNRDVLRQARVLRALAGVDGVLVPEIYGEHAGAPVEVPPLFVMEHVPGQSYEPRHTDLAEAPSDADALSRAAKAARMLARMHAAPVAELGLADEPVVSLVDEIERWRTAAGSVELSQDVAALEQRVYDGLRAGIPEQLPPAVLHGDWRLGNMQCEGPDILGVIDWEIWSVGDPRVDLAWMQLMAAPDHPSSIHPDAAMLSPDELAAEYESAAGFKLPALDWFAALVRYKQAAASMLLVKNAAKRGDTDERWQRMGDNIAKLLAAGEVLLRAG